MFIAMMGNQRNECYFFFFVWCRLLWQIIFIAFFLYDFFICIAFVVVAVVVVVAAIVALTHFSHIFLPFAIMINLWVRFSQTHTTTPTNTQAHKCNWLCFTDFCLSLLLLLLLMLMLLLLALLVVTQTNCSCCKYFAFNITMSTLSICCAF